MTEDGRSIGVPAAGGLLFSGRVDARLDAGAKSLWLGALALHLFSFQSDNRGLEHSRRGIFSNDFLGCGRAGH